MRHQKAALPLHLVIVLVFGLLALACIGGGIYAISLNSTSDTKLDILGAHLSTGSVGVALVFIGLVVASFTIRSVLRSQKDLAALFPGSVEPEDSTERTDNFKKKMPDLLKEVKIEEHENTQPPQQVNEQPELLKPELVYVGPEIVTNNGIREFRASDPWAIIRVRFYYKPYIGSNPKINVRGHVFYSRGYEILKEVYKAIWDEDQESIYKRFSAGDAHDLFLCAANAKGDSMIVFEHHLERLQGTMRHIERMRPIQTTLSGNIFDVRIVLIGEGQQKIAFTSETNLRITLKPNKTLPEVELIKHSLKE